MMPVPSGAGDALMMPGFSRPRVQFVVGESPAKHTTTGQGKDGVRRICRGSQNVTSVSRLRHFHFSEALQKSPSSVT
jgi:hypothetical protein